jgi:hypothetical protein
VSGRPGSNRPPRPWQGRALPNELLPLVFIKNYTAGFQIFLKSLIRIFWSCATPYTYIGKLLPLVFIKNYTAGFQIFLKSLIRIFWSCATPYTYVGKLLPLVCLKNSAGFQILLEFVFRIAKIRIVM